MIALGMPTMGAVDPSVLIAWIRLLRDRSWPGPVYERRGIYPARARNEITEDFLNGPADRLFMFDSDQLPPLLCMDGGRLRPLPDVLEDVTEPVVCGLVYMRQAPYQPVAYEFVKGERRHLTPGRMAEILKTRSVVQVEGYGSGSLLVHRRVFEHLQRQKGSRPIWEADPEFDYDEGWKFFSELRVLGYKVWLDSRIEAAHLETRPITSRQYMEAHGYTLQD